MGIEVKSLFYSYLPKTPNKVEALKGVSLSIKDNSFNAIIGSTGSGKSTLIQTFNALQLPTDGIVEVDNFTVTPNKRKNKNIKALRKHLGLVFQFPEYQLFEETVEKDVAFGLKNFGYKEKDAIEKARIALNSVGIDESFYQRSPFELSGGEKRRIAIAGILAINPDILVLDEPTAGLDPEGSNQIMSLVEKLHKEGKTIILVTHDMELVLRYCSNVFVLHNGELKFQGTPFELFSSADDSFAVEIPVIFKLAHSLKNKGFNIQIENIRCMDDLISQIKKDLKK